jgi:hypothetical protein
VPNILSEYDKQVAKRQIITILNSPQGRDFGRWFLTERGKGAEGNLGKIIRELQDIEAECIRDLYSSPAPVQSR